MALNSSKRKIMEMRRAQVADKLRAGWVQREIALSLGVSLGTINNDVRVITEHWRAASDVDTATFRAQQLSDVRAIKARAWRAGGQGGSKEYLRILLQAIKLEAQITGTVAPPSFTFNFAVLMPIIKAIESSGVPPEQAGAAFEAWFKQYVDERQQQEAQLGEADRKA